jgi:hypothetical protein
MDINHAICVKQNFTLAQTVTISSVKHVHIASCVDAACLDVCTPCDGGTYTILRGATGALFTVSGTGTQLELTNINIDGNKTTGTYATNANGVDCAISNIITSGYIAREPASTASLAYVSGIAVKLEDSTITNCRNSIDIDDCIAGDTAGGIVGHAVNTLVYKCTNNSGVITARENAGGIIGVGAPAFVFSCINIARIQPSSGAPSVSGSFGGIAGRLTGAADYLCFGILYCVNNGSVGYGNDNYGYTSGGIVGFVSYNEDTEADVYISNNVNACIIYGKYFVVGIVGNAACAGSAALSATLHVQQNENFGSVNRKLYRRMRSPRSSTSKAR